MNERSAAIRNQSSADFQVCGIAGFQTRSAFAELERLPTGKSAIPQVENLRYDGG
jgi:hypothetical protein